MQQSEDILLYPTGGMPPGIKLTPQPRIEITADLSPAEAEERYYRYKLIITQYEVKVKRDRGGGGDPR